MNLDYRENGRQSFYVNADRCRAYSSFARHLVDTNRPCDPFTLVYLPSRNQILSLLHLIAICDRVNWDFLLSTLASNLWISTDGFSESKLLDMQLDTFEKAFQGYQRMGEDLEFQRRLDNLRQLSQQLTAGDIVDRIHRTQEIGGLKGALPLLSDLPVYREDPLGKKSHTLLHQLVQRRLISVVDEELIEPAVDYHLMRLYLRTSRVEVADEKLTDVLVNRKPVLLAHITELRRIVGEALRYTAQLAGVRYLELNEAEWAFARRTCERDRVACYPEENCPLAGICPNTAIPPARMLTEPESHHGYY